jgi:hypothetical protein
MPDSERKLFTIKDALTKLPTPDGKRFATIFEHGSLLVEFTHLAAPIHSSLTHATKSILWLQALVNIFVAKPARRFNQPTYFSRPPAKCIGSKTSAMT